MKLWDDLKRRFQSAEAIPVKPPDGELFRPRSEMPQPEDPAAVHEREIRLDAANKHVEQLDTGEDDPNRYTHP
jgi:hypothetical protein